ncbi:uncharacterized protein DUF1203 [Herbihabitans rhizosphaerae]|uniref:Uncharacterized protein DUF1203 n=1 Tax=Herbihabitans rhizosphaerae TaxID=1872711 RepID=A0A4Q7KG20_9PSEU|nr:DUF1203 domain-containing protein [Herbihabitans rhizosphaerae]RZS33858.1 uncharacterized protein DUF1203 [Herbihabitans rhizosphaerae]
MTRFQVHAIPPAVLDEVRATGRDVSSNPIVRVTADGGEPVRCCLNDARPGEKLILFGYAPPIDPASPYREIGAVFAHDDACAGTSHQGYPCPWYGRRQVLRSYDQRGWIVDTRVHDGSDPEAMIAELFADASAVQVHSRNIGHGCFMFAVTRA